MRGPIGTDVVQREQGGTHDRRRGDGTDLDVESEVGEERPGVPDEAAVRGLHEPTSQQDFRGQAVELETLDRRADERGDLMGESLDEPASDLVTVRLGEDERREVVEPPLRDRARMDRRGDGQWRREPEVRRHRRLEDRGRSAAILAPCRRTQRGHAEVPAATPVAGDRAEGREAHVAPVGSIPTQLMPVPHVTATPQPDRSRLEGPRTCRCPR